MLEYIRPWIDLMKIDLKSFSPKVYRRFGGNLNAELETIQAVYGMGICLKLVILLISDYNESDERTVENRRIHRGNFKRYSLACYGFPFRL